MCVLEGKSGYFSFHGLAEAIVFIEQKRREGSK